MPANLFLKHLMVLSNVGGEQLQRFRANIKTFFTNRIMNYVWRDSLYRYRFRSLDSHSTWTNSRLGADGRRLTRAQELQDIHMDVAMLLLHGGSSVDPGVPEDLFGPCMIGTLLGRKAELDGFVRQRYIHVSRITGGATANAMGQLCQQYVCERLQAALVDWVFSRKSIPGMSQNAGRTDMAFDIVAESPSGICCAVEVSFQVTTNSTIERKAGQAQARQSLLHKHGHHIAYVIDGAGNLQRRSAVSTILAYSDKTVTFKDEELDDLATFMKSIGTRSRRQT
jgi:hypothetical protein